MKCAGCPKGHLLLMHSSTPQCVLDKFKPGVTLQVKCDLCKQTMGENDSYFHCHEACNYDVCLMCGPTGSIMKEIVMEKERDSSDSEPESLRMPERVSMGSN